MYVRKCLWWKKDLIEVLRRSRTEKFERKIFTDLLSFHYRTEKVNKNEPVILHGKKPYEIPPLNIGPYKSTEIKAADTGPDGGLVTVNKSKKSLGICSNLLFK